jgi:hypothetical protein
MTTLTVISPVSDVISRMDEPTKSPIVPVSSPFSRDASEITVPSCDNIDTVITHEPMSHFACVCVNGRTEERKIR